MIKGVSMPKVLAKASAAIKSKLPTFKAAQDAFLQEVGAVYLSKAETVDAEELRNWEHAGYAWPLRVCVVMSPR
jgi:hypothetical protein